MTDADRQRYTAYTQTLTPAQQQRLSDNTNFYELSLHNVGGLVMPVILQLTYADGSQEIRNIPVELWRKNNEQVTKVVTTSKPVVSFVLDPFLQTADTDLSNNAYPRQPTASRFELFQQALPVQPNPMQLQSMQGSMQKAENKPLNK